MCRDYVYTIWHENIGISLDDPINIVHFTVVINKYTYRRN